VLGARAEFLAVGCDLAVEARCAHAVAVSLPSVGRKAMPLA
jgi:hypothetical protein